MIVIPMAGMSSRFFKAGYSKPKYMLEANGVTLFEHAVNSFKAYFSDTPFLFIVKDVKNTPEFVRLKATEMGISNFYISILESSTRGQAETVTLGLEQLEHQGVIYNGAITIFNIDTFRPDFIYPEISRSCDGYIEVFRGKGDNWSFAKPMSIYSTIVEKTAEKKPISDLCSTGLYFFNKKKDYLDAYYNYLEKPASEWEKGELYVAPLYNVLIEKGLNIHYHLIEDADVIFCGVPSEYENLLKRLRSKLEE
ncbi:dTDP-glucose pyrophosphorylase [Vibrio crassostreae]|uniref:glycosyltransferase family 2 protein n=1 Tax=Vibrio crassostreae TaxID=246167 RepID=UPI0010433F47|nr:glycosyltransferase family 2 protein [Vibrio crassostreae]TCN84418.1 hypothetical protein EDB37_101597 [Vibrio crassostreae]CAK2409443.1 dTDP-glucose pyrophosphorylase [Vibrio crassostreae]CAK2414362.1 dTDP-glucose pyrophosphorylase [Vibrio crassostreae]CAK3610057.1 dTDP-glucose pyrophosphorylase [Vibrio crassostreae]CAK3796308.1 dTDP-glucose pyrophosphorylase [Vibrio crassostreae]